MKIAYLILAHYQPNHLGRLIKALATDNAYFFIHIDKKQNIDPFIEQINGPQKERIVFIKKRAVIYWGGYSMVEATLCLIKEALFSGIDFKYFCLLSGSSYPLKHKEYIEELLLASNKEFISIDRCLNDSPSEYKEKITKFHYIEPERIDKTADRFKELLGYVKRGYTYPLGITPYHGSQWWCLTRQSILYIDNFIKKNKKFLLFHRYTHTPDEVIFQSLMKASPFCEKIMHDYENGSRHYLKGLFALHYVQWEPWKTKNNFQVRIFTEKDYGTLIQSEALFARKFDEQESKTLLDHLDKTVHYNKLPLKAKPLSEKKLK